VSSDSFFILNVAGGDDSDLRSECRGVLYSNMCYVERSRFRIPDMLVPMSLSVVCNSAELWCYICVLGVADLEMS
jgi:hypothetical protein